jgi:hypothetical protein
VILTFRPIKVRPDDWREAWADRPRSPFGASYSRTLEDLDREIRHLGGSDPFLQLDITDADVRLDGQLRPSASPNHPGVLLTFQTRRLGPLTYATDAFSHWHANLRAIALGLDALRRVERYGIANRGQQYAGYRELPSGIAVGRAMTVEDAARLLIEHGESDDVLVGVDDILGDAELAGACYREAAKKTHPDVGGDADLFRQLTEARDLLVGVG